MLPCPCNPSIGTLLLKGLLLEKLMLLVGFKEVLLFFQPFKLKMLNTSKGPAIRALRAQIDKDKYSQIVLEEIEKNKNITIIEDLVESIYQDNNEIKGVILEKNKLIQAPVVVITTGVYMNSKILVGHDVKISGPDNEKTTSSLSLSLIENGIKLIRLKTGTPARIYADSIEWDELEEEILPIKYCWLQKRIM